MKVLTIIMGIILVIGGFFCMLNPMATFFELGWVAGLLLLLYGIQAIADYINTRKLGQNSVWDLVGGIIITLFSIFLLISTTAQLAFDSILPAIFSGVLIAAGITRIMSAITLRRYRLTLWVWALILGILTIVLGVYGFFHPAVTGLSIGLIVGFYIVMQGFGLVAAGAAMPGKGDE